MTINISKKSITNLIFNYGAAISMIIGLSMILGTGLSANINISSNFMVTLGLWKSTVVLETGFDAFELNSIGIATLCFLFIGVVFSVLAFITNCQLKKAVSVSNILLIVATVLFIAISIAMFALKPNPFGDGVADDAIWHESSTDDNLAMILNWKGYICLAFAIISLITTVAYAAVYTITLKTKKISK